MELWKRKNATLACEWDVDSYETNEVDRPEFHGVDIKVCFVQCNLGCGNCAVAGVIIT